MDFLSSLRSLQTLSDSRIKRMNSPVERNIRSKENPLPNRDEASIQDKQIEVQERARPDLEV